MHWPRFQQFCCQEWRNKITMNFHNRLIRMPFVFNKTVNYILSTPFFEDVANGMSHCEAAQLGPSTHLDSKITECLSRSKLQPVDSQSAEELASDKLHDIGGNSPKL